MKRLLLSLAGFCLLASFTINKQHSVDMHSLILESMAFECPECKEESEKCINPLHKAYREEVSAAADKLKAGKISEDEYDKACFEASSKKDKPLRECLAAYNACCFEKTQEIMDKEEKN